MKSDQELYRRLRDLPKEQLWREEVPRFNAASQRERMEGVALIRTVGMIFSRFGSVEEKGAVRDWLLGLLKDPQEKIRRYAMAALPKIGAGESAEEQMLVLLKQAGGEREKRHLGRALEKVGGTATLAVATEVNGLSRLTEQKVRAGIARRENATTLRMEALIPVTKGMCVFLRCRRGLEHFVREEAMERLLRPGRDSFRLGAVRPGCVTLLPLKPFSLSVLYGLRCFATVGFGLGTVEDDTGSDWAESLARCIASPAARDIMNAATVGAARYRLDFPGRGHQRGAVRQVVDRAYALSPEILNDSRQAPWSVDVILGGKKKGTAPASRMSLELRPRLYPDPRLFYRQDDVAAASHPPLAAAMARLAGPREGEVVWDPFCGSGLELVERALLGGVKTAHGTDLDSTAIGIARANFNAAQLDPAHALFTCCDFRDALRAAGITPGSVTLIITNPPLGRRVRVRDMQGLFADLYAAAARALQPGGRLVFANPLRGGTTEPCLKLKYREPVDLGGFECRLEMYVRE